MSLTITQLLVPAAKYGIKCPYGMDPTRVVIHNTANDASAMAEASYAVGNDKEISYHYAVDDIRAVQTVLLSRNGWHAGDGGNGIGNRQGIGVEICYSKSGGEKFVKAEQNAALLVATILKQYDWGIDRVTKHQDYPQSWGIKYCPHRTLDLGWQRFLDMVQAALDELNGVTTAATPVSTPMVTPSTSATTTGIIKKYSEKGTFYPNDTIIVRDQPSTKGNIIARYYKGEKVTYHTVHVGNGYVWLQYNRSNGQQGYIPCREYKDGKYGTLWGSVK